MIMNKIERAILKVEILGIDYFRTSVPGRTAGTPSRGFDQVRFSFDSVRKDQRKRIKPGNKFLMTKKWFTNEDGDVIMSEEITFDPKMIKAHGKSWVRPKVVNREEILGSLYDGTTSPKVAS